MYIYILFSGVESNFQTPYTCLAFQQKHIQNPFKHLRRSVFACPVNDFKPLTVCAKTLYLRRLNGFGICLRSKCIQQCFVSSKQTSDRIFRIPIWLGDNLPSFDYSGEIAQTTSLRKARRGRDSSPLSQLLQYNTHAPSRTTFTIQANGYHHHLFIQIPILCLATF